MNPLNIPLSNNPTRQNTWRVVVFVAPIIITSCFVMALARIWFTADTLSSFAPDNTEITVRILHNAKTQEIIESKFHGTLLFANAPFTLNEIVGWSKRDSAIFINDSGIVGVAITGKLPAVAQTEAVNLGLTVTEKSGRTYLGTVPPNSEDRALRLPIKLWWPRFNGEVLMSGQKTSAPLRLAQNSLTIHGLGRMTANREPITDELLVKISVSSQEAQTLLGFDVPLVFPGLNELEAQMTAHGFNLTLGQDDQGPAYSISIPSADLRTEALENMVSELYHTKSLTVEKNEGSYTTFNEIVASSAAKPITTTDPSATISYIEDNSGGIVRTALTAHGFILTNRPVTITDRSAVSTYKNSCLPSARQWISIKKLSELLPTGLSTLGWTMPHIILESQEIAFSKRKTRVCW